MQDKNIPKLPDETRRELAEAYQNTSYIVEDRDVSLTIRLGDENEDLNDLLAKLGGATWAFLTAYNPFSTPLPETENLTRQAELTDYLDGLDLTYFRGYGKGDDPSWEPEPSLLILDIGRDDAITIGRQVNQNAILWGEVGQMPELIWCF